MIYQNTRDDCGNSVIRNYLSFVMKDDTYETMYLSGKHGDFLSLKEEMEHHGVSLQGRMVSDFMALSRKAYPFILQVSYPSSRLHFILVTKRRGRKFDVIDSEFGNYVLTLEELYGISTGRALVTMEVRKQKRQKKLCFFSPMERILYFLLFVLQSLALTVLFHYISSEIPFEYKVAILVFSFLLVFFQVALNKGVRKRMDEDILVPYLKESKSFEDYASLSFLITALINRASSLVSYSSALVISLFVFLTNGNFVSLLGLVSIIFAILMYSMKGYYSKLDRDCSLKEELMKSKMDDEFEKPFEEARKMASAFEETNVSLAVLECLVLSLLTVLEMTFGKFYSLNFYLFYLFLGLSFTMMTYKVLSLLLDTSKVRMKMNSLSIPLHISMKSFFHFVYNKTEGGSSDGEPTCTGLS